MTSQSRASQGQPVMRHQALQLQQKFQQQQQQQQQVQYHKIHISLCNGNSAFFRVKMTKWQR